MHTQRDLPTAHRTAQAGIAPVAAIIIALLAIGGGGYVIKKGADK